MLAHRVLLFAPVMEFVDIGSLDDLPTGRGRAFGIAGKTIAVFRTPEGVFALDGQCPHRGGPLADGDIIGPEIVCPWHLWGFDLRTGICGGNAGIRVATHEVRIEGDRVTVNPAPQLAASSTS